MCPPKLYAYTSEDYLRSITTGNHKVPPSSKIFFRELRKPKTKRAWVAPYPPQTSAEVDCTSLILNLVF